MPAIPDLERRLQQHKSHGQRSCLPDAITDSRQDGCPLSYESSAALKFVVNVFVWIDALARVATGSTPIFHGRGHLLRRPAGMMQLEQLTGCENWVVSHMVDIGALDEWKKEMQATQRLSLRDLVARAAAIEGPLTKAAAARLGSTESVAARVGGLDAHRKANRRTCVTHLFALAALTYLHVVVSGFNPALDEVRRTVADTLAALEALPDPRLLVHLAWPLTVTGCMAQPHQEGVFRDLLARADQGSGSGGGDDPALGRCRVAMQVMEGVWKRRDSLPDNWAAAMQLGGTPVLLL
ncbi:putative regulatory protein [Diplodia seriata]|uniref:Putative regulatory protein n=1 Tax=Diplodia seriata TaxID=420778 RepID=A0A0G2EZW7_9PEZI|nr:putative regulatory protein [Diplodia seriata]